MVLGQLDIHMQVSEGGLLSYTHTQKLTQDLNVRAKTITSRRKQ